jgi:hypothetical protein
MELKIVRAENIRLKERFTEFEKERNFKFL